MLEIKLSEIRGVHPNFARVERELDLAPIAIPECALIPPSMAQLINRTYPLVVSRHPDCFCIGQTTIYRWLTAYAAPDSPVRCIVLPGVIAETTLHQLVLIERLVAPALARITPQQIRDLYRHIKDAPDCWPHKYKSHAHLARLVGVKPLKGRGGEE